MEKNLTLRKGAWTLEEDDRLRACIAEYGEGQWHRAPLLAGLNRCRKSCRMRWSNYLKPGIKRGDFEDGEIDLLLRLHKLLGNRWALIARRLPGRTANDIKNYWNTHVKKQHVSSKEMATPKTSGHGIVKPRPCTLSINYSFCSAGIQVSDPAQIIPTQTLDFPETDIPNSWWENLINGTNGDEQQLCNSDNLEENVAQHTQTNAVNANQVTSHAEDWIDFCLDDVNFSDLYRVLHDD